MYNAEQTIAEALQSVCSQTYADLDILVVDDGSTDASPAIVRSWPDPRVRLLSQPNAGVATARNSGAASTDAPYLAFLDADDVWHSRKIEAQISAFSESPDALVWCWYEEIDYCSSFRGAPELSSGESLQELCRWNIIGNGSSMMVSRRAFQESGGFDTTLRDRGAQGCEDYSFALRVAQRFPMRLIPERLVGYRISDASMSTDAYRMWRSHNLVIDDFEARLPEFSNEFRQNRELASVGYYYRSLQVGDYRTAYRFLKLLDEDGALRAGMRRNFVKSWLRSRFSVRRR
jgi:glycosyltransferase involved in cell wall biosynthesis